MSEVIRVPTRATDDAMKAHGLEKETRVRIRPRIEASVRAAVGMAAVMTTIVLGTGTAWADDAVMFGGDTDRNMVSHEKGLPATWDVESGKNVKWRAELGHPY